jgi:hypothetical protein
MVMDSPDLEHGDTGNPPPTDREGDDRRPDPDPIVVAMISFMFSFCATAAFQYGRILIRLVK